MSCNPSRIAIITLLSVLFAGCYPSKPLYLRDVGDMSYYLDRATDVEYPDVNVASLEEVTQAPRPITVIDPDFDKYSDMTLEQCVSIALQNSKVLRGYGTPNLQGSRVAPGIDNLVNGPAAAGTMYNIAVRESEPGFISSGQLPGLGNVLTNTGLEINQGVESALAEFDTQFASLMFWSKQDQPRNVAPASFMRPEGGNAINPLIFQQDSVSWDFEFAKKTANGTQLLFRNTNQYISNNNPLTGPPDFGLQQLPKFYQTNLELEIRQPLLRGRGAFIQRMPIVISRIGTDQEIANLEAQLQNMVTNVEIRYWELYCAYRNLEAAKEGRNAALETWRIVYDQFEEGADVNIQQVAQASEQYHFFDAQVIDSFNNLLVADSNLRWLLGIATTDGRIIRPIDEATFAPVEFDWSSTLDEALSYRPELRQQRWEVKKRELAVAYSKNALLPELNVTGLYRWLGFGQQYATSAANAPGFPGNPGRLPPPSGAVNDLYGGDYQEFSLGLDYRVPVGFRRELSNVRNAQLKLARDIARFEDMELDVTREISEAIRALDANRRLMQSSFNRWKDTEIENQHFKEIVELGLETLDVALDAQRRQTQAEAAFYAALCEYNKLIALIHRRKGTILAYNGICFAEGPWPGKAYQDAEEYARRRGASRHINYGWSRPQVISQGNLSPSPGVTGVEGPTQIFNEGFGGEYYDSGDVMFGQPGEVIQGEIINGVIPENGTIIPSQQPTPSSDSSTRNIVPPFVRQVGFEQDAANTSRRNKSAERKETTMQASPASDTGLRSAKRLERTVGSTADKASQENKSIENTPVVKRAMNWEKFGLTRPGSGPAQTQAAIKTNK